MTATAVFSHRPWQPEVPYDQVEDLLHSVSATSMGIAFGIGVVAAALARGWGRHWRMLDYLAVSAVARPVGMVALPDAQGLVQRLMFTIAYAWYAVEAGNQADRRRPQPQRTDPPGSRAFCWPPASPEPRMRRRTPWLREGDYRPLTLPDLVGNNGDVRNNRPLRAVVVGGGWFVAAYWMLVRPWHLRWGATEAEVRRSLPGDELVPTPVVAGTRAITIDCPPEETCPWLAQQGYGRAGWYSYWIDNDLRPSPDRIVPELQHLAVGDVLTTGKNAGFTVVAVDEGHYWVGLIDGELGQISVVQLVEADAEESTRLIIRFRASFPLRLTSWAFWIAFDPGDFLFMRREMLGIRNRAERAHTTHPPAL